jgi:hypothetical protein
MVFASSRGVAAVLMDRRVARQMEELHADPRAAKVAASRSDLVGLAWRGSEVKSTPPTKYTI